MHFFLPKRTIPKINGITKMHYLSQPAPNVEASYPASSEFPSNGEANKRAPSNEIYIIFNSNIIKPRFPGNVLFFCSSSSALALLSSYYALNSKYAKNKLKQKQIKIKFPLHCFPWSPIAVAHCSAAHIHSSVTEGWLRKLVGTRRTSEDK